MHAMRKGTHTMLTWHMSLCVLCRGFIRLAMQTGSHIVPCFAFGQTGTFKWFRPGPPLVSDAAVQALSRRIGAW
jgi:hypothetical protein